MGENHHTRGEGCELLENHMVDFDVSKIKVFESASGFFMGCVAEASALEFKKCDLRMLRYTTLELNTAMI